MESKALEAAPITISGHTAAVLGLVSSILRAVLRGAAWWCCCDAASKEARHESKTAYPHRFAGVRPFRRAALTLLTHANQKAEQAASEAEDGSIPLLDVTTATLEKRLHPVWRRYSDAPAL